MEIWSEYSTLQVEFREKSKAVLGRFPQILSWMIISHVDVPAKKIKITNNNLTTEEIENKLDNGDISMFSTAIIQVGHWLRSLLCAV